MRLLDILAHAKDTKSAGLKMKVHGLAVTIEHSRGTVRRLHDDTGKLVYAKTMQAHYGYFDKTKGRDGDEVDCFVGPVKDAKEVYIIHMLDKGPTKRAREDEDKCMLGYPS